MKRKNDIKCNIRKIDVFIISTLVLTTAFFVYSFFYLLIDIIRFLAVDYWETEVILSGSYRIYFNVFFAGIGVLLGQAFALQYLMSRIGIKRIQKFKIVNDSWFSIWTSLIFIMQCVAILLHYDCFFNQDSFNDFIPYIPIILLSALALLFIISWNGLRRYMIDIGFFKRIIGVLIFLILSFCIGQIKLLDDRLIEDNILHENVIFTHQINYPKSAYSNTIKRRTFILDFAIGRNPNTKEIELFYENTFVQLEDLDSVFLDIQNGYREEDIKWLKPGLRIDKDILVKELLPIFEVFYLNNMDKFTVYVDDYLSDHILNYRLDPDLFYDYLKEESRKLGRQKPNINRPKRRPLPFLRGYLKTVGGKDIYCYKDSTLVEGKLFTTDEFLNILKSETHNDYKKMIHNLFIDTDITFGEYIQLKSILYQAYEYLRNERALQQYNIPFRFLSREQSIEIKKAYPINIKEFGLHNLDSLRMEAFFKANTFSNSHYQCIPY